MPTVIAYHEIEDRDHWLASQSGRSSSGLWESSIGRSSTRRIRARVAVIFEGPDLAVLQEVVGSEAAAEAMAYDGVRADTIVLLVEA